MMRTIARTLAIIFTALFLSALVSGCQEEYSSGISGPENYVTATTANNLQGKQTPSIQQSRNFVEAKTDTAMFHPESRGYKKSQITLDQGSKFTIPKNALTPPKGMWGQDVIISLSVEVTDEADELNVTFGPHGSQFDPPAELRIKYDQLGNQVPNLFYIDEDGEYIEQSPDDIDEQGQFIIIYLHHFSRYALSRA